MKTITTIAGSTVVVNPQAAAEYIAVQVEAALRAAQLPGVGQVEIDYRIDVRGADLLVEIIEAACSKALRGGKGQQETQP